MSIKTGEENKESSDIRMNTEDWMQDEIDELRAALKERDAKHLAGLEAIALHVEALESKVAAQRVVLEQALEALTWYVEEDDVIESMDGNEFWCDGKRKGEAAITEIQGVLHEHN